MSFIYIHVCVMIFSAKPFRFANGDCFYCLCKIMVISHTVQGKQPGSNWCFSFAPELVGYSAPRDLHRRAAYSVCESWFLIHQDVYHDLFVCS